MSQESREVPAPGRPPTLGADYLGQAVEAIRASGSSDALYDHDFRRASAERREDYWTAIATRGALNRRVQFSRTAMLFVAFAAEAYINEFIAAYFTGNDRNAIDRMPPAEKYTLAPRLALGKALFPRGVEPVQTIARLFKQRDLLVHPKPGRGLPEPDRWVADPVYNPAQAVIYLAHVASATKVLVRHTKAGDKVDLYAELILRGMKVFTDHASVATRQLPAPDDAPVGDLMVQAMRVARDAEPDDSEPENA